MEKLQTIARKAVTAAIAEGLISSGDRDAIRAVAGLAASMYAAANIEAIVELVANEVYTSLNN
ncbi:hypothetical protein PQE12_gp45 [Arthrobacter phage Adumb2043]|uniref:Uncharacterized protein n=1 Tax=Arthrobacter phage Adumb2043 TaxID=2776851 RepID=A0A7M1CKX1_9CAUD|nr:hypothetical protein PQE12_gp45 [Arthrobacter phage Adumb2043]QOP65105.1 hypothetical protein SEA_ADUMB2043_45 [Arthrobacter phage Adumb2043]